MLSILLTLIFILNAQGDEFHSAFTVKDFQQAESAKEFLRFDMDTKKLGLFKKHLAGFVLQFEARGSFDGERLSGGQVRFKVRDISTDLYARDDQLWNFCLGMKENPEILIAVKDVTLPEGAEVKTEATVQLRGGKKLAPLYLKRVGQQIEGKGNWSLKDLGIPDPSIGIASVDDSFEVSFRILNQNQ